MPIPESAATDHELILLILADGRRLSDQVSKISTQLDADRERFSAIALNEQKTEIAIGTLRQDVSRAMLEAGEARKQAASAQDTIDEWKTRIKTLVWVGGPIAIILGGIAQEVVRRLVFP